MSLVIDVCFQVEVSATGRSLMQKTPTECGVSGYDLETLKMSRPRLTLEGRVMYMYMYLYIYIDTSANE